MTCGPTCLLSVLRFFGDETPFERILELTPTNPDGGTLAVYLGQAALQLGYEARIYCYNLRVVDPTWSQLAPDEIREKLLSRAAAVKKPKLQAACRAYAEFLSAGGQLEVRADLTPGLVVAILEQGRPPLCGLSATYLYQQPRERPDDNEEDDVAGDPVGHVLVISGHENGEQFFVRDPAARVSEDPGGEHGFAAQRLLNAVLLGIVSYDAVLLEIWPRTSS